MQSVTQSVELDMVFAHWTSAFLSFPPRPEQITFFIKFIPLQLEVLPFSSVSTSVAPGTTGGLKLVGECHSY